MEEPSRKVERSPLWRWVRPRIVRKENPYEDRIGSERYPKALVIVWPTLTVDRKIIDQLRITRFRPASSGERKMKATALWYYEMVRVPFRDPGALKSPSCGLRVESCGRKPASLAGDGYCAAV